MSTRRRFLGVVGAAGAGSLAGCLGGLTGNDDATDADGGTTDASTATPTAGESPTATGSTDGGPPTADRALVLQHSLETLQDEVVSGGPPKDGIPSIDEPSFEGAAAADGRIAPGDPVFGVARDGVAKAYPQYVLVWHEIVNDTIAGEPVSVTYCPLTGTVLGFPRGETEFGVSGNLVNSNLVMYDRATDSRWPQVLATAISGPFRGQTLREFPVTWTTWKRWREAYPDTQVLTEDTGFARDYGGDPYGGYNPTTGYYSTDRTMFAPIQSDDRLGPKDVVIGARTGDGAVAFQKDALRSAGVLTGAIGDDPVLAVHDPALDTGYVYRNPDGLEFAREGDAVAGPDGDTHRPDALPLERLLRFDAMWFAWAGFYPETELVR